MPSLISSAKPSSCENAYADLFSDLVLARIDARGLVANMLDLDLDVLIPNRCIILTLSASDGITSNLMNRYAIIGSKSMADVIRTVNQNIGVEQTA